MKITYFVPFIIALFLTPLIRRFALWKDYTDKADGDSLKIHRAPVALLGGMAILAAVAIGIMINIKLLWILIGGVLIFSVGLLDDIKGLKPIIRLAAQILAGVIVVFAGVSVNFIPISWIAIFLTLFYIVGAVNAFNVIDGMDGLCSGISLIACIGFFFIGLKDGNIVLINLSVILFMSLLGYLPYNLYPARIFLGDAGSGFLGYMLGVMAVISTSKPYDFTGFIAPVLIICIPVFDMAFAILRRFMRGVPLFAGDRGHIYDLLLKRGWDQPRVWGVLCAFQVLLAETGILIFGI